MQTIALVDVHHGRGHHLTYMRFFCKTLLEEGYRVISFYPAPEEVTSWLQLQCPQYLDQFHSFEINEFAHRKKIPLIKKIPSRIQPPTILARWLYTTRTIQNAVQEIDIIPNLVFLNWLDSYLNCYLPHQLIDRIFPYPWSGIYFRPGELRFGKSFPFPHYEVTKSSRCQGITLLDEVTAQSLQKQLKYRVIPFPDLTDEAPPDLNLEIIHMIREKAGKRKIVGLLGSLSKRKGLLTLLKVAQKLEDEDWFFLFAGPLDPATFHHEYNQRLQEDYQQVQAIIRSAPSNCFFHLQSIPDGSQFNAFVNTCDVLFAAYENFPYSSNILTKAGVFKKPIIVSRGFCMDQRVQQFGLGLSIIEGDVEQCIEALQSLRQDASFLPLKFDFAGYHQLHSREKLCQVFQELLHSNKVAGVDQQKSFECSA